MKGLPRIIGWQGTTTQLCNKISIINQNPNHSNSAGYHGSVTTLDSQHDDSAGTSRLSNHRYPKKLKSEPVHSNTYGQNSTQVPYTHAGINYKNKAQLNKRFLPRSLQQQRNYRLHGTKTQQLRTSSPAAIQSLKWVAIERAKQGEFSATKNISRYSPIALTALTSAFTANQIPSSSETSEIAKRRRIASSAKLNYQISLSLADLSLHQTPPKRQRFTKISRPLTQTLRNSDLTQNDGVSPLDAKGSDFFLKFHQFDSNSRTDFTR
ncbi:formin-like protein 6 [Dorcoceras hygrometricum]|uniref:Formin-like protein 6 n=1 Tax=Dorcoceras hygrometricum TaxID=472368 RepID=A0A2Z7BNS2_9LAMI|nr:formin-like protein 6 [Dorcoceras hygrometricum]